MTRRYDGPVLLVVRQPRQSSPLKRVLLSVALALVAHALLAALLIFMSMLQLNVPRIAHAKKSEGRPVTLRGLTAEQFAKNRGEAPPNVKDERKVVAKNQQKAEEKKPEVVPKGQVVATAPGNEQVDPNAKFVSETNNAVKKETRAKEQTAFYKNAMPQRTAPKANNASDTDATDHEQVAGNNGLGQDDRPLLEKVEQQKLTIEVPDVKARSEVAMKIPDLNGPGVDVGNRSETEAVKGNSKRFKLQNGVPGSGEEASAGRLGQPGVANLLPSAAVLDKVTGAAANDHLRDVDEGEGTYLNTREWKYASFFNRVKQSVGQQWYPQEQLRLRDPTQQIYGGRDRYTVLAVTLNQDGRLKDAFVEKSSGLDFLDLEAVKAFERAQPFPNPPPGLVAADQTVHFQFGFFLEMSGRPGMRLFRAAD